MTTADTFAGWRALLAGEPVKFDANDALPGYYRTKNGRNGEWKPVGIWPEDDGIVVMRDGVQVPVDRVWPWCARNPITYEAYVAVAENGQPWPDQHEAVNRLHNAPPPDNSLESLRDAIEDLAREAAILIDKGEAKSEEESDRAADLANAIAGYRKKADEMREAEIAPHLAAQRATNDRWRGILAMADIYKQLKDSVCAPFLAKQKAAKRKAEEDARRAAEEAAKAGKPEEAAAAQLKADNLAKTRTTSGSRGRAVHLHAVNVVTIVDRQAVLVFFADNQSITDLLQSLAEKAVNAGISVPGTKVDKVEKAR